MNYEYWEEDLTPEQQKERTLIRQKKKQKQQMMFIILLLIGGVGYYFLIYIANERKNAEEEIKQLLANNPLVSVTNLDTELWEEKDSWEIHLSSLYSSSQIQQFTKQMKKAIIKKNQELADLPRKRREEEIQAAKDFLQEEERNLPETQSALEELIVKINETPLNDLSTVSQEFANFVQEKRDRRKRLYWKLPAHNWADRWLLRNAQSLSATWDKMTQQMQKEPSYFDTRAIYKINFPTSLWNQLTEEQKELARKNGHDELKLKDDVWTYEFSSLIKQWKQKVVINPIRGELNPQNNELDNNALFFGAPRTGKSVMAEIITYEADCYPLVIIQGSSLTPSSPQKEAGLDVLLKFIFTISSITYDLFDDYGFDRDENGEVKYILFLDEADQVCTTTSLPPKDASTQLTFLKECMGSDSKSEESKNLYIAATNHLESVNIAIYQSGRLSNPLDFSWTLDIFMTYAQQAGISSQFPYHWLEKKTLNAEDNKQVNRFNKIIFDKDFLPFWNKFINNADTQKELKEEIEWKSNPTTGQQEKMIKKKGIQWGEFFEFFWQLYDSKQLENSNGKWEKPRKPTIEEVVEENVKLAANKISADISKSIEIRLNELNTTAKDTKNVLNSIGTNLNNTISSSFTNISVLLSQMNRN